MTLTHATKQVVELPTAPLGLDAWRAAVTSAVVPLDIREMHGVPFRGHLEQTVVDDIALFEMVATPHVVRRTDELIANRDCRYYKLSLQLAGRAFLEQDGRTAHLRPGDLAIYDTHRPYTLRYPEPNQAIVMVFPQDLVDLPPEEVSRVTATRFPSDAGLGRVINPFFVELGRNLDQLGNGHAARLVRCGLDLLVTMLSEELQRREDPGNASRSLAHDIRAYILDHLGDEDLSPAAIARANYISLRHLYTIFSPEGQTVSAWIRSRRLEHIRRDLVDPLFVDRPVSWVAGRWGLHDAAHFSRIFKAEFGESPSAYRRRHVDRRLLAS